MSKKVKITDLLPDENNFNLGTTYGGELIEQSLKKFGAGRSVVIDKNGKIIAGNKTIENAQKAGITDVIIVESTGDKLIAVKRTDVALNSATGRELALADNVTSKENILFDFDTVIEQATQHNFDPAEWGSGIKIPDYSPVEQPPVIEQEVQQYECMCPECLHEFNVIK